MFQPRKIELGHHELLIRQLKPIDAEDVLDVFKKICDETPFLGRPSDTISIDVDAERTILGATGKHYIGAFVDGKYVGNVSWKEGKTFRTRHRATIGIGILQAYTGMHIGWHLLRAAEDVCKEEGFEQLTLTVAARNINAQKLYTRFGFEQWGLETEGIIYEDGSHDDMIYMSKKIV